MNDITVRANIEKWMTNTYINAGLFRKYGIRSFRAYELKKRNGEVIIFGGGHSLERTKDIPFDRENTLTVGNTSNFGYLRVNGVPLDLVVAADKHPILTERVKNVPRYCYEGVTFIVTPFVDPSLVQYLGEQKLPTFFAMAHLSPASDILGIPLNHYQNLILSDLCASDQWIVQAGHVGNAQIVTAASLYTMADLKLNNMYLSGMDLSFTSDLKYGCPRIHSSDGVTHEVLPSEEIALENLMLLHGRYTDVLGISYLQQTAAVAYKLNLEDKIEFWCMDEKSLLAHYFVPLKEYVCPIKVPAPLDTMSSTSINLVSESST